MIKHIRYIVRGGGDSDIFEISENSTSIRNFQKSSL
jgi:hypothetical protein